MYQFESPRIASYFKNSARGTAQKGVYLKTLGNTDIWIPSLNEQHRIVTKIEELFSELDKGIENLKTAQVQLKVCRQALLKHAFEGKFTAQWRARSGTSPPRRRGSQPLNDMDSRLRGNDEVGGGNDKPLETADTLLKRIQQERV
ncbi:MAG: restriction endonuclease subunit S [Nitrosomonas sp.]|uniref:restriction endonuclease subunit S n=1 Tax=Nitrosomonas sp. TaxID=42353 RepID=UPI00272FD858|nr:restriction endonuclease subunit S [Nitrosomonas sp.]MDP1551277.1 restriction endonuclease subunit S [Nitrosomonas sp.]MDP2222929.1 restriction endonuclease subunit S [Nitrosomonas sp.]